MFSLLVNSVVSFQSQPTCSKVELIRERAVGLCPGSSQPSPEAFLLTEKGSLWWGFPTTETSSQVPNQGLVGYVSATSLRTLFLPSLPPPPDSQPKAERNSSCFIIICYDPGNYQKRKKIFC